MKNKIITVLLVTFLLVALASITSALKWDNTVYYPLNRTSGDVYDITGNGNNGTNNGATRGVAGILNNSFEFDGTNDWVDITIPNTDNSWTQNVWINTTSSTDSYMIDMEGTDRSIIRFYNGDLVWYDGSNHIITSLSNVNDGKWHMITLSSDGNNIEAFLDGESIVNITSSVVLDDSSGAVMGGVRPDGTGSNWAGRIDEYGVWDRDLNGEEVEELYNNGNGIKYKEDIVVSLIEPTAGSFISGDVSFNSSIRPIKEINITNATIKLWDSNDNIIYESTESYTNQGSELNFVKKVLENNFTLGDYKWNVKSCYENSSDGFNIDCEYSESNFTFKHSYSENNITYNQNAYETDSENFTLNISSSYDLSNPLFYYKGRKYKKVKTTTNNGNYILNKRIDIPSGATNNDFKFGFKLDGTSFNSSTESQTVDSINITECTGGAGTVYINYTFKDELNQTKLSASIVNNWDYFLGNGNEVKTFSYQNTSENSEYNYCFTPDTEDINIEGSTLYSREDFPQREVTLNTKFTPGNDIILYLLRRDEGGFPTFQFVDASTGDKLSDVRVTVERDISGTIEEIISTLSDDSGVASMFLSLDFTYIFTFSKDGYKTKTQNIKPSVQNVYTVGLQAETGNITGGFNQTKILEDIVYSFKPNNPFLNNNTNYDFGFLLNSNSTYTVRYNLSIGNGTLIYNDTSTGTDITISNSINTKQYDNLIAEVSINGKNETYSLKKEYTINKYRPSDFSLWLFLKEWNYQSEGSNIAKWIQMAIIMAALITAGYSMYTIAGSDVLDSALQPVIAVILIIWIFSIAGWLEVNYFPGEWLQRNGIASLISILGIILVAWRATSR